MVSKFLLLLVLLGSVSSDRLRFHLENLVDRNISACDDFYHHACSQHVDPNEFFIYRVSKIFQEVIDNISPGKDKNSPIAHDLKEAGKVRMKLKDNNYEMLAREKCKDDLNCYIEDQEFWAAQEESITNNDATLTSVLDEDSLEDKIQSYIIGTSSIIKKIIKLFKKNHGHIEIEGVEFHNALQARIHIIEFMKSNASYTDFHEVKDITEAMKTRIVENIKKSPWLNRDKRSKKYLKQITEIVENIAIYHDFDELDKNITLLQKLNRDLTEFYFRSNRKTGVRRLDTIFAVQHAFDLLKSKNPPEIKVYIDRVKENFGVNAFFSGWQSVTMLAPLLYRPSLCSEILEEPIMTYFVLGHELYHSLFYKPLYKLYGERTDCIKAHYKQSCSKFKKGACASGHRTIDEDAPDIESYRLIYEMVRDHYTSEEMKQKVDGLGTTLEQAYFYYAASGWCSNEGDRSKEDAYGDPHSAFNIRINGAFSLMPEFTEAFGCKAKDPMYVEQENSCYVFGPNS